MNESNPAAGRAWWLDFLGAVYAGGHGPARWTGIVARLADSIPAYRAALWLEDTAAHNASILAAKGFDPGFVKTYVEHFARINPYAGQLEALQPGKVQAIGWTASGDEDFEFRQEWLRPQKIRCAVFGAVQRQGSRILTLGLFGEKDAPDPGVVEIMETMTPHLARAAEITRQRQDVEAQHSTLTQVLNRMPTGTVVLDVNHRILFMNRIAKRLVGAKDGLFLDALGHVRAGSQEETLALNRAITDAVGARNDSFAAVLTVKRPAAGDSLSVMAVPVTLPRQASSPRQAVAALFISAPERRSTLPPDLLQRLYGLTQGEIRVAQALVDGHRLEEMAGSFDVSQHTVRNQLKAVFRKTGTNRQSDLVKLLLTNATSGE